MIRANRLGRIVVLAVLFGTWGGLSNAMTGEQLYTKGRDSYNNGYFTQALKYLYAYTQVAQDNLRDQPSKRRKIEDAINYSTAQIQYAFRMKQKVDELGNIKKVVVSVSSQGKIDGYVDPNASKGPKEVTKFFSRPSEPANRYVSLDSKSPAPADASSQTVNKASLQQIDGLKKEIRRLKNSNTQLQLDLDKLQLKYNVDMNRKNQDIARLNDSRRSDRNRRRTSALEREVRSLLKEIEELKQQLDDSN